MRDTLETDLAAYLVSALSLIVLPGNRVMLISALNANRDYCEKALFSCEYVVLD